MFQLLMPLVFVQACNKSSHLGDLSFIIQHLIVMFLFIHCVINLQIRFIPVPLYILLKRSQGL